MLDNELNNAPVHRLVDFNNVNTAEDTVSWWRKVKKATTKGIIWAWRNMQKKKDAKGKHSHTDESRPSIETRRASVISQRSYFDGNHGSSGEEGIQMTPVPSPLPGQSPPTDALRLGGSTHVKEGDKARANGTQGAPTKKFWGSVMNQIGRAHV